MIEFKNVSKTYGSNGTKALNNVNIKIDKGEFVFIVGSSGAGKSTFLKLIMHEEKPTEGEVIVNGYSSDKMKRREVPYYRRTMGIVFQDFRLIPKMSVYDNVAFALRVIGAREKEIRKRVPYILGLVGLAQKARCMPNELSGGEQQRVSLARALVNNPKMIVADEPTGNVDPEMSQEIIGLLTNINNRGTTVVMVTHEHELVRQFQRRVIVINNGQVVSDTPDPSNAQFEVSEPDKAYDMFFFDENTTLNRDMLTGQSDDMSDEAIDDTIEEVYEDAAYQPSYDQANSYAHYQTPAEEQENSISYEEGVYDGDETFPEEDVFEDASSGNQGGDR